MTWPPTTHQHVEDAITNAMGGASTLADRLALTSGTSGGAGSAASGRWYNNHWQGTLSTATMTAQRLYLQPFRAVRGTVIDRIGVNVTTASTGVIRLGIYAANPANLLPGALLVDAGTVDAATTGGKELSVSVTLSGACWLAAWAQNSPVLTGLTQTGIPLVLGATSPSASGGAYIQLNSVDFSAGLGSPAGGVAAGGQSSPLISVRVA